LSTTIAAVKSLRTLLIVAVALAVAACDSATTSSSAASSSGAASTSASSSGAASSTSSQAGGGGKSTEVTVINNVFLPPSLSIKSGVEVKWVNGDSYAHTVTADNGAFDLPLPAGGASLASVGFTFPSAGTFAYHCKIHSQMHGTVTVTG
jgi:plastocyanin